MTAYIALLGAVLGAFAIGGVVALNRRVRSLEKIVVSAVKRYAPIQGVPAEIQGSQESNAIPGAMIKPKLVED